MSLDASTIKMSVVKSHSIWIAYSLLWYLILPLVLLRLAYRAYKAPEYGKRVLERFGIYKTDDQQESIWVHAVSVGETLAAAPLIKQLIQKYPDTRIVVTTMTPTGSERVKALFGDKVFHVYAPYDYPGAVNRFFKKINPRIAIIMETELWPNTLRIAHKNGVPVVLANARLSERSANGYKKFSAIAQPMFDCLDLVAAQAELDANRFRELGIPDHKLFVTGSIKFDIQVPAQLNDQGFALRQALGNDRDVLIAASTHEGEESQLLDLYLQLKKHLPDLLLVIVPRHPERFRDVGQLVKNRGLNLAKRSKHHVCVAETDVYLGDTMGELMLMYQASDVVFVGGSLVKHGGHNPMEPAALGKPILTGPHTFNFEEVMQMMRTSGAVKEVKNSIELISSVQALFDDAEKYQLMAKSGIEVVKKNRGALPYLMDLIQDKLNA